MKDFETEYYLAKEQIIKNNQKIEELENKFKLLQDSETTADKAWNVVWWIAAFIFIGAMVYVGGNIFLQAIQQH